jgi:hypothetical protein
MLLLLLVLVWMLKLRDMIGLAMLFTTAHGNVFNVF